MNFGVVVFPGTWSDADFHYVIADVLGQPVRDIWHRETDLRGLDCVILPGGFAYGDYLRAGAVAARSPVMEALRDFAGRRRSRAGVLQRLPDPVRGGPSPRARSCATSASSTAASRCSSAWRTPTRPSRGRCARGRCSPCPSRTARASTTPIPTPCAAQRAAARSSFATPRPTAGSTPAANPNGSLESIAGIVNEAGNVLGLMPHPERAAEAAMGGTDGLRIFHALLGSLVEAGSFSPR